MSPTLIRWAAAAIVTLMLGAAPRSVFAQAKVQAHAHDSAQLALGQKLFESKGLCFSCHGKSGEGLLGPATKLAGRKFTHTTGSIEELVVLIQSGITADQSASKQVMPPRGGSRLTDAEVEAVAAYVKRLNAKSAIPTQQYN